MNDPPNGENGITTTWDPQSNIAGAKIKNIIYVTFLSL